ncbi:hypothetical protein [uncultured Chryseobacterium sp.]|uniref:hypothetical protein n=1 Tax=uncultured Chryseobacterium sp. TaxID=259322 RepID=UPI0025DBB760|nr:hypothetical protein [uncultured Chryseobacterium sp.]
MKAAKPLDKSSGNPHGPGKKQRPEKPVVVPLPVTEFANLQTQKPESTAVTAGSANPYSDRKNLNGTIAPVHGSKTIYGQGAEIRYGKFQESLAATGDLNHPETKEAEKKYMATLSINEMQEYQDRKSGTYLPKTLEEQAAAYRENKIQKEAQQKAKPAGSGNTDDALTDLSHAPATELAAQFNAVQDSSSGLFNNKAEKAANRLPKVNAKSGSAFTGSKPKRKAGPAKKTVKPGKKNLQPVAQKPKSKEVSFTQSEPLKKTSYSFNAAGQTGGLEKQAQHVLGNIQLDTSAIPAAMQQDTRVQLTGEADTQHLAIEQQEAAHDMGIQKDHAENDIHKDYGENDIIKKPKDEILKPSRKISAKAVKKQPLETLKLEGIDKAGINEQFAPVIRTKIGTENEKYKAAELEHDQKVLEQEKTAETQIGTEKDRSHEKQLKTVKDARSDVHSSRVEWQQALDQTEADFARKSGDHAKATLGHIKTEKSRGETTAQGHVDKANTEALKKKEAAQAEARQKKTEQQKASGGFFGWVADKASAFINALKDALNYIFTKLRDAVKAIFEAAKTLVLAALELARKAIVSLIKAFASVIKGFLDIALAAFPGIRDRLKARIDKYVAVAEKLVNQAFEVFKKAVVAVIDFLAETVDKLLGILQSVYDGILTVVGMIVKGDILALLEKLGNIKDALFGVTFDTIKQGGMEELLGANLDESLSPEELMAAMQMGLLSVGNEQGSDDGMPKAPWTNANVGVDVVSFEELSPEMQAELKRMQKAGQTEATIGERNDPSRTMSSVMEEAKTSQSAPEVSGQKFNDGLTPMKRAEIKWEMMKTGIKQWWDKNWLKVVGGIIAALVVFIAAEVVTGGAITAALPVIMPILADVFIGVTIAQLATHFVDGLAKSWAGEIKGGTKAFSRGLAAALIELAMYLGFKLVEVAAKAITQLVKGGIKLIKAGARSVMNFSKFIIKEGKVLFKGMAGKNLGKLSKSLRKLADDILERMRIKKVLLRIQGKRWEVLAEINPLFVIMSGPMPGEDLMSIIKKDKAEVSKGLRKGDEFIDEQGRKLMKISNKNEFTKTPNYREIFALANKVDISNDVIHHLIEKGSDFAYLFEKELINAPKSLRAIPKGNINKILHLSDIRIAWNEVYSQLDELKALNMIDDANMKKRIIDFAAKTDVFIKQSLDDIGKAELTAGRQLTENEIETITNSLKYLLN